jgi:hypothetical protein
MSYWDDYDPCEYCDDGDCNDCFERKWLEEVAEHQREEAISKGGDPIIFSEDLME